MNEEISLLHEIDDALRADKAYRFWQKYGTLLLASCACVVVLTAASSLWKHHLHEGYIQQTHVLLQADIAARDGRFADALQALGSNKEWSEQHQALVGLKSAMLQNGMNKPDQRAAALKDIANSTQPLDSAVRDSAALRLYADTEKADLTAASADGRAFAPIIRQVQAAALIKSGKNKEAAALLKPLLADLPAVSPEYDRAQELLRLTGEEIKP